MGILSDPVSISHPGLCQIMGILGIITVGKDMYLNKWRLKLIRKIIFLIINQ